MPGGGLCLIESVMLRGHIPRLVSRRTGVVAGGCWLAAEIVLRARSWYVILPCPGNSIVRCGTLSIHPRTLTPSLQTPVHHSPAHRTSHHSHRHTCGHLTISKLPPIVAIIS